MTDLGMLWYSAPLAGVVVLYAVPQTNANGGQFYEIWLAEVGKDHEQIATIFPFARILYRISGGVIIEDTGADSGVSWSGSGSVSLAAGTYPPGATPVFEDAISASKSESYSGSIERESDLSFTETGDINPSTGFGLYVTNALTATATANVSVSANEIGDLSGDGDSGASMTARMGAIEISASATVGDVFPSTDSDTANDSASLNLNTDASMELEGFLSVAGGQLRILLKAQRIAVAGLTDYQSMLYGARSSLGEYLKDIDTFTLDASASNDWREPIVDPRPSSTAIADASDPCVADYGDDPFALLQGGTLYQVTSTGLQAALRTAGVGSTHTGTLSTRIATSGASCSLDTASTQNIEIPGIPATAELLSAIFLP